MKVEFYLMNCDDQISTAGFENVQTFVQLFLQLRVDII